MFDNFDAFRDDFMEKIGNNIPWTKGNGKIEIKISQSRQTEARDWDDWHDVNGEWEEDFEALRVEIINAVGVFYFGGKMISNRFVNAVTMGAGNSEWISEVECDYYSDYYDNGQTQTITIYLDKLFNLIRN